FASWPCSGLRLSQKSPSKFRSIHWQSTVIFFSYVANFLSAAFVRKRFSTLPCPRGSRESMRFPESSSHRRPASPGAFEIHPADDSHACECPGLLLCQIVLPDPVARIPGQIHLRRWIACPRRIPIV